MEARGILDGEVKSAFAPNLFSLFSLTTQVHAITYPAMVRPLCSVPRLVLL